MAAGAAGLPFEVLVEEVLLGAQVMKAEVDEGGDAG